MVLVIFGRFLKLRTVLWAVLGTVVENAKHKKVEPGIYFNFQNNPIIYIWVPKMRFYKMYIFGSPIELEGPGMVFS